MGSSPLLAKNVMTKAKSGFDSILLTPLDIAAGTANCFFPRRRNQVFEPLDPPKMPRTVELGPKPANRYVPPQTSIFSHPQIMTDLLTIKKDYSPS